jgi:hypothetical protein
MPAGWQVAKSCKFAEDGQGVTACLVVWRVRRGCACCKHRHVYAVTVCLGVVCKPTLLPSCCCSGPVVHALCQFVCLWSCPGVRQQQYKCCCHCRCMCACAAHRCHGYCCGPPVSRMLDIRLEAWKALLQGSTARSRRATACLCDVECQGDGDAQCHQAELQTVAPVYVYRNKA